MLGEDWVWVEKYRPRRIADTILPERLKSMFEKFVEQKNIPNLILCGGPGTGKTSVSKAMLEELGCDYLMINGSMNGNIDTLRNDIRNFASTVSIFGNGRKYVILDEADYINQNTQAALRNFMEEYSKNCGFILTCNYKARIIKELHSRCSVIDFKINRDEIPTLASEFLKRIKFILESEGITYNTDVLVELIKKHLPDWRRILNELQTYSSHGSIDTGILTNVDDEQIKELMGLLKEKDFTNMRKWVARNTDLDANLLYSKIYTLGNKYITKETLPMAILIIGKYQYQHSFCANHEINLACCLTELMAEASWV